MCLCCIELMCGCGWQVKYVMYLERCKADEAQGRGSVEWRIGTRLAVDDVEGRERARVHGVECAARDAEKYEARCLLEPAEEAERAGQAERNAVYQEKRVAEMRLESEAAVPTPVTSDLTRRRRSLTPSESRS